METNSVRFQKVGCHDSFTISIDGDYSDYHETINALLRTLHSIPPDLQNDDERYYICNIIRAMLPSKEQLEQIVKMDVQKSKKP